ncbi:MAG TPA: hypothetical protein VLM37_04170, partial [Fibrobacteraceae bacterium]|nr:hypothetical protein [Fibrobacteraceae bacterium]
MTRSPPPYLRTAKVKEEWNFINYAVTVINQGSVTVSRPSVTYFAKAEPLLTAMVDYSNPAGVTVSVVDTARGYSRVVYTLPNDLAAGASVVFHTRIYKSDWTARD